ncbi:MAG TPA: ATP-binding protein [Planctomycetaceae bacterium]|nr:ATP-binding protein [Planctomycetaceae bacterium]
MKRDILYVDDEADNIVVFEAAFEDEFTIYSATSGAEALELCERVAFPVVVSDQRMPKMTGVELFEILRVRYPHTKRVLLTGYTDPAATIDAINKGEIFHFVKKPWERHLLYGVLVRAFETHDLTLANSTLTEKLVTSERCALLGQMSARIAHEMGNQLCILPLLELIEDRYADQDELVKIAKFAKETHGRLADLIREVKDFMRFEQDEFRRDPLQLAEAVHELASFLRFDQSIPRDRLHVAVESDPLVTANKIKLQQVLVNLIKNAAYAIKGRKDGRVTVTVGQKEGQAWLGVADNGCGMAPEVQARIWEPFFTTKGNEGNGLGLDISRRLIETHGGRIACTSQPDVGTTFEIWLPLCDLRAGSNAKGPVLADSLT